MRPWAWPSHQLKMSEQSPLELAMVFYFCSPPQGDMNKHLFTPESEITFQLPLRETVSLLRLPTEP